jgi:hypothetical protein
MDTYGQRRTPVASRRLPYDGLTQAAESGANIASPARHCSVHSAFVCLGWYVSQQRRKRRKADKEAHHVGQLLVEKNLAQAAWVASHTVSPSITSSVSNVSAIK